MQLSIKTDDRFSVLDVTDQVHEVLPDDADGVATVFCRHTTAGVVVNEPETRLLSDIDTVLHEIVPDTGWEHDRIDDNADAHLRSLLLGESVTIPVRDGELALGTWQAILFVDSDGPRTRTLDVTVH